MCDVHLPDVLIFPPGTDLHNHPLYISGLILLQDKVRSGLALLYPANNVQAQKDKVKFIALSFVISRELKIWSFHVIVVN